VFSRRAAIAVLILALAPLALTLALYTRLPEVLASHWSIAGDVDGQSNRAWAAFTVPAITLLLWVVFTVVPRIAPARPVLGKGGPHVTGFVVVLLLFFNALHAQLLLWNLGTEISFSVTVPVGIGLMFICIGRMLGHVEPNWVVGIRTYWTLKHPLVWARTHQRAALLFKILGVIYIGAAFFRGYILLFILLPAVFLAIYLPAYSFLLYQRIERFHDVHHRK
jgi:uncharacterized membrane protein